MKSTNLTLCFTTSCVVVFLIVCFSCKPKKSEDQITEKPIAENEQPAKPQKMIIPGQVLVRFKPSAIKKEFSIVKGGTGFERLNLSEDEINELISMDLAQIRRLKPQLEIEEDDQIRVYTDSELRERIGKKPRSEWAAEAFEGIERDMILVFNPQNSAEDICEKLQNFSSIESCTPLYEPEVLDPVFPDDPGFTDQLGFHNTAAGGPDQAPNFDIDAPEAWEIQQGDASIVIGVIDTEIDICHPDLYEKIWINTNELPPDFVAQANALSSDEWPDILTFIDLNAFNAPADVRDDMEDLCTTNGLTDMNGNGYIDGEDLYHAFADDIDDDPLASSGEQDDIVGWNFRENNGLPIPPHFHGTGVAGLAAAQTNNSREIAGVGWKCRILPIRGSGSPEQSIEYAIKKDVDVITSSLAPVGFTSLIRAVVEELNDENIVFTTSLGNIDKYIGGTQYAEQPYIIAVSNFRSTGIRAFPTGSSYSVNTDVAAPGEDTYSINIPEGTAIFGGTSGANPIIAGIMSLLKAERDDLSPEQLRQVLRKTAVDIPEVTGDQGENTLGFDYYSGWGLANAFNALNQINTDPWAEAKITTQPASYYSSKRKEELHIIGSTSDVNAFAGIPGGDETNVRFEHAPGPPPVEDGSWIVVSEANHPYINDALITSLTRDDLQTGINTTRLTVSLDGNEFMDYGRVDVPHAYMDIRDSTLIYCDFDVNGFAFHPDFSSYELQVASGYDVDEDDDDLWERIGAPVDSEKPPVASGSGFSDQTLFHDISISDLPDGEATLRLVVSDIAGDRLASFTVPVLVDKTTFPFQEGFPASVPLYYRYGGPTAYDLTGDGNLELIVTSEYGVKVFKSDGTVLPGWSVDIGGKLITCSPAVGDVNGDGLPEIVVRASDSRTKEDALYVFSANGDDLSPWPLDPSSTVPTTYLPRVDLAPVLADLDADGDLEILLSANPSEEGDNAEVKVFQGDGGHWVSYTPENALEISIAPAVGDVDADGQLDVVVLSEHDDGDKLSVWRSDGSALLDPMSMGFDFSNINGVVLADLDNDDDLEIVLLSVFSKLRAYHHNGDVVSGWNNISIPGGNTCALSAGDLIPSDGDDAPQIIVSYFSAEPDYVHETLIISYGMCRVNNDGTIPDEWSNIEVDKDQTLQQPIIFDVDNDGQMEILIGPWFQNDDATFAPMYGYNHDGTLIDDDRFPLYFTGELPRSPVIADLDRDGDLEIAAVSNEANAPVEVFDLDANDDNGAVAWGMELHDPLRSSNFHGGIRLIEPTTTNPSEVVYEDGAARNMILIRLRKEIPTGTVSNDNLTVNIGGIEANIVDFTTVEGENWILVIPPEQTVGTYNIEVEWNDGGIHRITRQRNAIQYLNEMTPVDQILVIDKSGSMLDFDKYLAAHTAANFYISTRGADDQAGIVSFYTEAEDVIPGMLLLGNDGSENRGIIAETIISVEPPSSAAMTSIGEGLSTALLDVLPDEEPNRNRALVLLSDGLENTAPFWDRGADPVRELFELPENDDVVIHTIALGPDADRDLHDAIAEATGGTPRFVYLGSSMSIFGRLAETYKQVEEVIQKEQRIFTQGEEIALQETAEYTVYIPQGTFQASFAVSYREPGAHVRLVVVTPDSTMIEGDAQSFIQGPTSSVLTVETPEPGIYTMYVSPLKMPTEVLTTVSIIAEKQLFASLAWVVPAGEDEMEGTILAGVMDPETGGLMHNSSSSGMIPIHLVNNNILNLKVRIVAPDKSVTEIQLYDNGLNRDGRGYDGIYAAPISFAIGGGYQLTVIATVPGESGGTLEKSIGFFQPRHRDRDLDDITDSWEILHFPDLPIEKVNPLTDHDADGLNTLEEFLYRTDPHNYDSDGDGRPDGREVDEATDPLKQDPPDPQPGDADGDGIPDDWEQQYFPGMDPSEVDASADSDGDGLSNYTESQIGTDPTDIDSDHDGINDYVENSWELPRPSDRVWHPQPEKEQVWNWLLILLIIILLLILVVIIIIFILIRRR